MIALLSLMSSNRYLPRSQLLTSLLSANDPEQYQSPTHQTVWLFCLPIGSLPAIFLCLLQWPLNFIQPPILMNQKNYILINILAELLVWMSR